MNKQTGYSSVLHERSAHTLPNPTSHPHHHMHTLCYLPYLFLRWLKYELSNHLMVMTLESKQQGRGKGVVKKTTQARIKREAISPYKERHPKWHYTVLISTAPSPLPFPPPPLPFPPHSLPSPTPPNRWLRAPLLSSTSKHAFTSLTWRGTRRKASGALLSLARY